MIDHPQPSTPATPVATQALERHGPLYDMAITEFCPDHPATRLRPANIWPKREIHLLCPDCPDTPGPDGYQHGQVGRHVQVIPWDAAFRLVWPQQQVLERLYRAKYGH